MGSFAAGPRARFCQQQVDGDHTPWELDPVQVAIAFLGQQGVSGVMFDDLKLVSTTGTKAVVEADSGPISRVCLERVVRQDTSGIWSGVGYDPR